MPALLPAYHATLLPEWIDYNGHLRDAFYGLVMSYAIDEVMDHLGMDSVYRERTRCTLYTLELHMHYLHEVQQADALAVETSLLDADRKRMHVGCRFTCARLDAPVAAGEAVLLHVQQGAQPAAAAFPDLVVRRLDALRLSAQARAEWGPASRKLELRRRQGAAGAPGP